MPSIIYHNKSLCFLMIAFVLISFLKTKKKVRDLFLIGGLFILAICSYRHISFLIICESFVFVRIISEYIEKNNKEITNLFYAIFSRRLIFIVFIMLFGLVSLSKYIGLKTYEQDYLMNIIMEVIYYLGIYQFL